MTVTTGEWWEVNGTPLNTYATNIATLTGRLGVPQLRGSNWVVDGRDGEVFVPKVVAARTISLGMWILGCDEDGAFPLDPRVQFNENYAALMNLFWSPTTELALTRRLEFSSGMVTLTASGQVTGGITPEMTGRTRATLVFDILLSDPYWYQGTTPFIW